MKKVVIGMAVLSVLGASMASGADLSEAEHQARQFVRRAQTAMTARQVVAEAARNEARELLQSCPDDVRRRFLQSVVLVDGKFAGARVAEIAEHLGQDRYRKLLSSLGVGTAADNEKYYCASRATCEPSRTAICTRNCRSGVMRSAGGQDSGYVSFDLLLKDRPDAIRNRFLDSLAIIDGRVTSPYLDRAHAGSDKVVIAVSIDLGE